MDVTVIGGGFVGATTAAVLAEQGHDVVLVERDTQRAEALRAGRAPFFEPGLDDALSAAVDAGRLTVAPTLPARGELVFVCVGTPSQDDGSCDTSMVVAAAQEIAAAQWSSPPVVVVKSTVPPGTTRGAVLPALEALGSAGTDFGLASNPEFLREGSAVDDARQPDRVVFGCIDGLARRQLRALHAKDEVIVDTTPETSELIKYAANAFLATKISFANEVALLCEQVGCDVGDVMAAVGLDHRIAPHFFGAGAGYGGSCFPKDVAGLRATAAGHGVPARILAAVEEVNEAQPMHVVDLAKRSMGGLDGKTVALLGLSFKPGTSDVRMTRAVPIAQALIAAGATVRGYDPEAGAAFGPLVPDVEIVDDLEACLRAADAAIIQAEWPQFKQVPALAGCMREPIIIDARRMLDGSESGIDAVRLITLGRGASP